MLRWKDTSATNWDKMKMYFNGDGLETNSRHCWSENIEESLNWLTTFWWTQSGLKIYICFGCKINGNCEETKGEVNFFCVVI